MPKLWSPELTKPTFPVPELNKPILPLPEFSRPVGCRREYAVTRRDPDPLDLQDNPDKLVFLPADGLALNRHSALANSVLKKLE